MAVSSMPGFISIPIRLPASEPEPTDSTGAESRAWLRWGVYRGVQRIEAALGLLRAAAGRGVRRFGYQAKVESPRLPESGVYEQTGQSEFSALRGGACQHNIGVIGSACCPECFDHH